MKLLFMIFLLFITGCGKSDDQAKICGSTSCYKIPSNLKAPSGGLLYDGKYLGDNSAVTTVTVPIRIGNDEHHSNITLNIYSDRTYTLESELYEFARQMIKNANRKHLPDNKEPLFSFKENLGGSSFTYLMNFDPTEVSIAKEEQHFFAKTILSSSFQIGSLQEVNPKLTCTVYFVTDGMLIQAGAIGQMCNENHLFVLAKNINSTIGSWKIENS